MKEYSCNLCTTLEHNVAWLIGFIDGLIIGLFYSCSEYVDDDTSVMNEMTSGFKEGTWVGTIDK
jgi:hypothetical protein